MTTRTSISQCRVAPTPHRTIILTASELFLTSDTMSTSTEILEDSPVSGVVVPPEQTHDDYGPQINLTLWGLSIVAAIWLVVRVYCKYARHRGLWWDDYVLIASWVSSISCH